MEKDLTDEKRIIINALVNSGINITPQSLKSILDLKNPLKDLSNLIKELSFIPNFNSHLTESILKKISNEELQKVLKRTIEKSRDLQVEKKSTVDNRKLKKLKSSNLEIKTQESKVQREEIATQLHNKLEDISYNSTESFFTKEKLKIQQFGSTKSNIKVNPVAKDFEFDYTILKDPTGKLYTNGEYSDFYQLTLDKFKKLHTLMRKRPEVLSAVSIKNILRLSRDVEISTIGLVKNIRQTKNGNYFLELEDLTGRINVLVRKDSEDQESIKTVKRIVFDQMLYVKGMYNSGEKFKNGIIFAEYISKIDIPTDYQPNRSTFPISLALISDTHIGSNEFEEPMFKRFLNFLNGKVGNKKLREIAGRVKYIIINGDLVDGIGVYPNQQNDLIISDIYKQFKKASELLSEIPDYIKIFYVSGNHEPVRNALPRPAVPKKYCGALIDLNVTCLGNPSLLKTHNVNTLIYHGESIHDMNLLIHDLDINKPIDAMKEFLICRHLAPIFGEKTQIAPAEKDFLVIDKIPDIFHTGHIHINGSGKYNNVTLINSGCFQAQTDFMKSFGIDPTPGIVPIIELDTLKAFELDLKSNN
ncbi:MAG: DNA-directed DNA polymerase II small subunit [Promethearchaeota archaeon]